MTSHETALEAARTAIRKAAFRDPMADISSLAEVVISAYISTLSPEVSGLVERFDASAIMFSLDGIPPKPSDKGSWVRYEDYTALSLQLAAVDGERPWNKAAGRPSDKQGPVFCAVREALDKAHTACFKHPDRDVLGMSYGPFSGVNYALGAVMSLEASLTAAQEENERLRRALEALSASIFAPNDKRSPELEAAIQMTIDALSTPSKEDAP